MRLARVVDGVVVNVVEADDRTPDWAGYVPVEGDAWIGWRYEDGVFIDPNPPALVAEGDDV